MTKDNDREKQRLAMFINNRATMRTEADKKVSEIRKKLSKKKGRKK